MTLYELNINSIGKIQSLNTKNESTLRLSEMGLVPGSLVRMIKRNPFGGPVELKLNDYYIAIRKEDAQMINLAEKNNE
jgi:ferrous iron transport protein A